MRPAVRYVIAMTFIRCNAARAAAEALIMRYPTTVTSVVTSEIDALLAAKDVAGALEMDRIRREVLTLLSDWTTVEAPFAPAAIRGA